MFICRHLLRRAYQSKTSFRTSSSFTAFIDTRNGASSTLSHVPIYLTRRMFSHGAKEGAGDGKVFGGASARVQEVEKSAEGIEQLSEPEKVPSEAVDDPLSAYLRRRESNRTSLKKLPAQDVLRAIELARQQKRVEHLQTIAEDVMQEDYKGQTNSDRLTVIMRLLNICCETWWKEGRRRTILQLLLQKLQGRWELKKIPADMLAGVARTCLFHSPPAELDMPVLTIIAAVLLRRIGGIHTANFRAMKGLGKYEIIWLLFEIIARLLSAGKHAEVLSIFQELVHAQHIPRDTLEGLDLSTGEFDQIVLTVLVRCCVQFGWPDRGAALLTERLNWKQEISPALFTLITSLVEDLLGEDVAQKVEKAASLLIRLLEIPTTQSIPHHLLIQFYTAAQTHRLPQYALTIYKTSLESKTQEYPAPTSLEFVWLFNHCIQTRHIHIARMLARRLVKENIWLPEQYRPRLVSTFAEQGFTGEARALYERYAALPGADRKPVVESPAVLVKLVSLCVARVRILGKRLVDAVADAEKGAGSSGVPAGRVDHDLPKRAPEANEKGNQTPPVGSLPLSPAVSSPLLASSERKEDAADTEVAATEDEDATEDAATLKAKLEDFSSFAQHVVSTYTESLYPLTHATHFQLTSLARAYMLLGRPKRGFAILRILLSRETQVDMADMNIALGAMAEDDVALAATMLERMVDRGIVPDKASFGTVIHQAAVQGNTELVKRLQRRARELEVRLDYKTYGSIVKQCALSRDRKTYKQHLMIVQRIVDQILNTGVIPSPKTGVDCVIVALKAKDPTTAFDLWKILVRGRAEWDDVKHQRLRRHIGDSILSKTRNSQQLGFQHYHSMLTSLRLPEYLQSLKSNFQRLRFSGRRRGERTAPRRRLTATATSKREGGDIQ